MPTTELTEATFSDGEWKTLTTPEVARRLLLRDGYRVLVDLGHYAVWDQTGKGGCYSPDQLVELACGTLCDGHGEELRARMRREKRSVRSRFAGINLAIRSKKRR